MAFYLDVIVQRTNVLHETDLMEFRIVRVNVVSYIKNRVTMAVPTKRTDLVMVHPAIFLFEKIGRINVKGAFADTTSRAIRYKLRQGHRFNIQL